MNKNPYEYLRPVTGQNFVGRNDLVDEICSEFSFDGGASYAIVGGRRFGKSSLISAIQERAKQSIEYRNVLYLSVDFNQKFSSPENFYSYILREFAVLILSRFPNTARAKSIPSNLNQDIAYTDFLDKLQDLLIRLPEETRIGLLLDEMDSLLSSEWHETLFDQLRTLIYSSPIKNSVSLLLAGSYYYYKTKNLGSPLMNTLRPIFLKCVDNKDVYALASLNKDLTDKATREIFKYSGGHPHLAQYILYNLWALGELARPNPGKSIEKITKRYQTEHSPNLRNWVENCGNDGCKVYNVLLNEKGWLGEDVVARKTKLTMSRAKQALVTLCFHGLAYENQDTSCEYRLQGELFRNWFIQNRKELLELRSVKPDIQLSGKHDLNIGHLEIVENKIQANQIKGNIHQETGLSAKEISKLFTGAYNQINSRPKTSSKDKKAIKDTVKGIENSLGVSKPDEGFLKTRLENLQKIAPDIFDIVLATIVSPASGFALVAKKIAEKIKKDVNKK